VTRAVFKKRKKVVKKGGLSFDGDDEGDEEGAASTAATPGGSTAGDTTPVRDASSASHTDGYESSEAPPIIKKRLKPNAAVAHVPKALTKSVLLKESQMREQLRKEYLQLQEAVKATDFVLPFVFFDGKSSSGGKCRMKKGDPIWLFLERARKVGADMAGRTGDRSRKDWARISVDDLMVVKGDLIIPHVRIQPKFPMRLVNTALMDNITALRLPHPHPQPKRRLQQSPSIPILLFAHGRHARAPYSFPDEGIRSEPYHFGHSVRRSKYFQSFIDSLIPCAS